MVIIKILALIMMLLSLFGFSKKEFIAVIYKVSSKFVGCVECRM